MKLLQLSSLFFSLSSSLAVTSPSFVDYDGYRVFRVKTGKHYKSVQEKLSSVAFDQWNHDDSRHIDIVLAPDQLSDFESLGLDYHCMHSNLGESIAAESFKPKTWKRDVDDLSWYESYHPYDDHKQYFEELQRAFPDNSELISSGTSYEGRDIFGIHLWGKDGPGKPAVLWHGTVHAREWITAPVIEYLTLNLIRGYNAGDNLTQSYVDNYDFWILPFVNPDGILS